jgi:putative endonuclease
VAQHRFGRFPGFTKRYRVTRLVFFECTPNSQAAVAREREIKRWRREKKLQLVEATNPGWVDLAVDWFEPCLGEIPRSARDDS